MTGDDEEPGWRASTIVDVSSLTLTSLASSDDSAIVHSIRQILAEVDRSAESIANWSSYID